MRRRAGSLSLIPWRSPLKRSVLQKRYWYESCASSARAWPWTSRSSMSRARRFRTQKSAAPSSLTGRCPMAATQGDQTIDVAFPEESWIVLRPEKVNLEDASHVKVECRRCACLVSVVEQYTQTTLDKARVTCGEL